MSAIESKVKKVGKSKVTAKLIASKAQENLKKAKNFTLLSEQERFVVMEKLQAQNPHPKSELEYSNNFELICAVILSAQTTDIAVNKVTPALFERAPNAKAMASLGEEGIAPYIKSIGLWRSKAKNLAHMSQILADKYQGQVPNTFDELIALPGVGSKTAKVVLNVAFALPFIAVDTHIFRVCNRIGLCIGKTPKEVEDRLPPLIAEPFLKDAHHYILLHGRYNCKAKQYQEHCPHCVVKDYCITYKQEGA